MSAFSLILQFLLPNIHIFCLLKNADSCSLRAYWWLWFQPSGLDNYLHIVVLHVMCVVKLYEGSNDGLGIVPKLSLILCKMLYRDIGRRLRAEETSQGQDPSWNYADKFARRYRYFTRAELSEILFRSFSFYFHTWFWLSRPESAQLKLTNWPRVDGPSPWNGAVRYGIPFCAINVKYVRFLSTTCLSFALKDFLYTKSSATKLHASRPWRHFATFSYDACLSQQHGVASFAALWVLSCLHSLVLLQRYTFFCAGLLIYLK